MIKKWCYIAGPMTGIPEYNFPAFMQAQNKLEQEGWGVFNPAEHDIKTGFNPETDAPTKEFLEAAMRWDVESIMRSDAIFMLPGWRESTGAVAEFWLAMWRHIPIYHFIGRELIDCKAYKNLMMFGDIGAI